MRSKLGIDKASSDWLSLDFQMVKEVEEEHIEGLVIDESRMPDYLRKDTFPESRLYSPPSEANGQRASQYARGFINVADQAGENSEPPSNVGSNRNSQYGNTGMNVKELKHIQNDEMQNIEGAYLPIIDQIQSKLLNL